MSVPDLAEGELEIVGRVLPASNHTLLCRLPSGATCVYKPVAGERPLWDFPDGSLAQREYAAFLVSEAIGWRVVPPTVLREGPMGLGMVQEWIETDATECVDLVPAGAIPDGFLWVLDAEDATGREVSLVHEDSEPLLKMAIFDVITNNTDRKGGHILPVADGHRFGVDHGICFHTHDKLRTVLWGWQGRPLDTRHRDEIAALSDQLCSGPLGEELGFLLTQDEIQATQRRIRRLLDDGVMPSSTPGWPSIPWPPF